MSADSFSMNTLTVSRKVLELVPVAQVCRPPATVASCHLGPMRKRYTFAGTLKVEPGSVVAVVAGDRVVDGDTVVGTVDVATVDVAVAADVVGDCDTTSPLSSSPRLRTKTITPIRSTAITAAPMAIG